MKMFRLQTDIPYDLYLRVKDHKDATRWSIGGIVEAALIEFLERAEAIDTQGADYES